jgi:hypothetical protein
MSRSFRVHTSQPLPDFGRAEIAAHSDFSMSRDFLNGAEAIAKYLGEPWTVRRVRYPR